MNVKLAKLFVEKGYLSLDNLKVAVEEQKNTNKSLGEIMITRGFITETQLVDLTNLDRQFSNVDLTNIDIDQAVIKLIPKDTAAENNLIPFGLDGNFLNVAMIDPTNLVLIDELRFLTGHNINPYIAEFSNIKNALIKYYNIQDEEVIQQAQPEQKPENKVETIQEPEAQPEVKPQENANFVTDRASQQQRVQNQPASELDSQVSNQDTFQASQEPKEEVKEVIQQEEMPEATYNQEKEIQKSTPNEITDVFAKDDSDYVSQSKDSQSPSPLPQNIIDDTSQQSSESSGNLFQAPGQESGTTTQQGSNDSPKSEENIFQAPSAFSPPDSPQSPPEKPVVGFQPAAGFEPVQNNESEPSAVKDSSEPPLNVFTSGNNEELIEDKTIELSIEAEELPEEQDLVESKEITDVFSIPPEENGSAVQTSEISAKSDADKPSEASQSLESSEQQAKQVEDLFKIPEPDIPAADADRGFNTESDLRSLKEDASYDNIESFNKNVDSGNVDSGNGNQAVASANENEAVKTDLQGLESVGENIAETEKPSESEPVFPIHKEYIEQSASDSKPTVLVVDDSPTVQKIVSVTLSRQGYNVEVSSNAMQALAKLNDFIPDIIFLDINLPHMDGYQLCKIIKGNDLTKEVPVVMLSGKDGFFDKMRGKMVGATDYITKPFEPSTLVSAIKKQGISIQA